jgi:hypothetical protein
MFLSRALAALTLSLAATVTVVAAPNRAVTARRNRGNSGIEGIVVRVHHDRLHRNAGWIKLRHRSIHRYGRRRGISAVAAASRRRRGQRGGGALTFAVNSSTRFQRLGGSGRARGGRVTFGSIRTGERVRVFAGSGQQHAARLVDILLNSSGHRHRYAYGNRFGSGRRFVHRCHPLIRSRVLSRLRRRSPVAVNRRVVPSVVRRPARHPLVEGRVAARQIRRAATMPVVKHASKPVVKHPTPPKHNAPPKHKNPPHPNHAQPHPHSTNHAHSSGHRKR